MSEFLTKLQIVQVDWRRGKAVWETLAPLTYRSERLAQTIIIPVEFITDLASVPRLPLSWLIAGGRGNRSAVLHDFAYQFGRWTLENGDELRTTRRVADAVFRESLTADPMSGAGPLSRGLMWLAVRLLAKFAWRGDRTRKLNPVWSAEGLPLPDESGP